uniref:G-protein coupled receptors family 1 profile domain-containing protein n=1 Tax=Haplochromis burtoni TaxID=8153 RepID=A0A3Q3CBW5_HAPBU
KPVNDLDVYSGIDYDPNITYDYPGDESFVKRGSEAVWVPALYSIVFFVGILGNIILLTVLVQKRRLWSLSDTFILHLSIADILLLLMLPFWAAQTTELCDWFWGIFSWVFGVIFKLNYYCGIFLLVCISLQNYLSSIRDIQLYSHGRLRDPPNDSQEGSESSLKTLLMVTSALGCLHASLRPLLYLGLCGNFRQHLLAMLRCNKTEPKGSLWDLGVGQRQQPDHDQDQQQELKQVTVVENPLAY